MRLNTTIMENEKNLHELIDETIKDGSDKNSLVGFVKRMYNHMSSGQGLSEDLKNKRNNHMAFRRWVYEKIVDQDYACMISGKKNMIMRTRYCYTGNQMSPERIDESIKNYNKSNVCFIRNRFQSSTHDPSPQFTKEQQEKILRNDKSIQNLPNITDNYSDIGKIYKKPFNFENRSMEDIMDCLPVGLSFYQGKKTWFRVIYTVNRKRTCKTFFVTENTTKNQAFQNALSFFKENHPKGKRIHPDFYRICKQKEGKVAHIIHIFKNHEDPELNYFTTKLPSFQIHRFRISLFDTIRGSAQWTRAKYLKCSDTKFRNQIDSKERLAVIKNHIKEAKEYIESLSPNQKLLSRKVHKPDVIQFLLEFVNHCIDSTKERNEIIKRKNEKKEIKEELFDMPQKIPQLKLLVELFEEQKMRCNLSNIKMSSGEMYYDWSMSLERKDEKNKRGYTDKNNICFICKEFNTGNFQWTQDEFNREFS